MRKLKLDLETLNVQSFQTDDAADAAGTVFAHSRDETDCTCGAQCNTYPGSACFPDCLPSQATYQCGPSTYYGCTYTDYESCGGTCAPCA